MFYIEVIPDVDMKVTFSHAYPHSTVCRLWLDEKWEFTSKKDKFYLTHICDGRAICHPQDQWDPNVGRKIALKNALSFGQVDRKTRTKVWNRYFETRGKVN